MHDRLHRMLTFPQSAGFKCVHYRKWKKHPQIIGGEVDAEVRRSNESRLMTCCISQSLIGRIHVGV